ncbi:MAG TPA: 2-amino-4-hydroxy-6-hydroxymethyldihydropteridine diphosphokinase [Dehalococcoidia bacterium]|nr:2-amino-4-hydroxy-6-hydroxymethyldihydropteridine diphosphokinase [Dehalococcoidia bacterium]
MLAYLGLGSNLDDRPAILRQAIDALRCLGDLTAVSSFYETTPVGYRDQPDFLNAVAALRTRLAPEELLDATQSIENTFGRVRSFPNAPRPLDIDLLYLDSLVLNTPRLTIPHPRAAERAFVLVPLREIAPDLIDPITRRTITDLAAALPDLSEVRPFAPPG